MKLTVKCFATLMPLTPPGGSLEFHGTDICDLLRQLSIPESEARIIFVNGIGVEKDALLHDGDRVGIFPPVGGGRFPSLHNTLNLPAVQKECPPSFGWRQTPVRRSAVFCDNHFFGWPPYLRKEVRGSCMRRQPIQERESMRKHRFFRGEGEPLPFLFGEHH